MDPMQIIARKWAIIEDLAENCDNCPWKRDENYCVVEHCWFRVVKEMTEAIYNEASEDEEG